MNDELRNEIEELWKNHKDALITICDLCVEAYKTGYHKAIRERLGINNEVDIISLNVITVRKKQNGFQKEES